MTKHCIACGGTGVNSKGYACAACIMNCRGSTAPKMKGNTVALVTEKVIPNGSIVRNGNRFGIVKGCKRGKYNIAVVVDGKHVGNENWFRRNFDVLRQD